MSETIIGGSRWDNLRYAIGRAVSSCNTVWDIDEIDTANYNQFLREKAKNPVAANIAMHEYICKNGIDPYTLARNKYELERAPENDFLVKKLIADYRKNYPNSGKLRSLLVVNDRFSLNEVKPRMTNTLKKLFIKLQATV